MKRRSAAEKKKIQSFQFPRRKGWKKTVGKTHAFNQPLFITILSRRFRKL